MEVDVIDTVSTLSALNVVALLSSRRLWTLPRVVGGWRRSTCICPSLSSFLNCLESYALWSTSMSYAKAADKTDRKTKMVEMDKSLGKEACLLLRGCDRPVWKDIFSKAPGILKSTTGTL